MDKNLSQIKTGIIGSGHLGLSLSKILVNKGLDKSNLKISYSGNSKTLEKIMKAGLEPCVSTNARIAEDSDIIFITIKPHDIGSLKELKFREDSVVVSGMAGRTVNQLKEIFNREVIRIMPSSPSSIAEGKGISALYPESSLLNNLLSSLGLTVYQLTDEDLFHLFTASVCLPAAFLQLDTDNRECVDEEMIEYYKPKYDLFPQLVKWAHSITPSHLTMEEKIAHIEELSTSKGVTEAIVNKIKNGGSLLEGFKAGVTRSEEIAKMI